MDHPPLLALVGFMGCGKTTVGRVLARRLALPFVDLDDEIEAAGGLTIRDWFVQRGEESFRLAERAALRAAVEALRPGGGVLALGGGAYGDASTRTALAADAHTVWLDVPLATIRDRVRDDGERPLFGDPEAVARLYAERRATYALADLRVDAAAAPEDVAVRILDALPGP